VSVTTTSLVSCKCSIRFETILDGEIICRKCGCVKGVESSSVTPNASKSNLYLDLELGSKNIKKFYSDRSSDSKSAELSMISNICNTFQMPQYFSHDVWFWYRKIRANMKMNKAKIIVLVFYQLCRYNEIPLNEKELNKSIQMNLGVKHYHNSLKVLCEANAFLDEDIPVLNKIGFNNLTVHNMQFVLRSKLKILQEKYSPDDMAVIERYCKQIYPMISGTSEDIAKTTVKLALEMFDHHG